MNLSFKKHERLKSRKTIELLFSEGKSVTKFPIKLFYLSAEEAEFTQAAFAVPKRSFKTAVSRNRIKRQLREAYRLNKHILDAESGKKFALLFLYIGKEQPQHQKLTSSMTALLKNISK